MTNQWRGRFPLSSTLQKLVGSRPRPRSCSLVFASLSRWQHWWASATASTYRIMDARAPVQLHVHAHVPRPQVSNSHVHWRDLQLNMHIKIISMIHSCNIHVITKNNCAPWPRAWGRHPSSRPGQVLYGHVSMLFSSTGSVSAECRCPEPIASWPGSAPRAAVPRSEC